MESLLLLKKTIGLLLCLGAAITFFNACSTSDPEPVVFDSELEPETVFVQGGTFLMGCPGDQEYNCLGDEQPIHQVTVSSFSIGKYPITQKQWQAIMGENPSSYIGENHPVDNISHNDAMAFITKLNAATGKKYRLPTEAEWEYAARGGNESQGYNYSGSNNRDDVAWCYGYGSRPVGTKLPNELGIYDMSGNIWEWCNDRYGEYSSDAQTNPQGSSSGSDYVFRGDRANGRVYSRGYSDKDYCSSDLGFRVAISHTSSTPLEADFTITWQTPNDQATIPPCSVIFTNTSNTYGLPTTYAWKINDTQISTSQDATYTFVSVGTYKVRLTATNSSGSHYTEKNVTIHNPNSDPEMVFVEGGTFQMGCSGNQEYYCPEDAQPAHQVTVSSFSIGKYPITRAQWQAIMGNNPSWFNPAHWPYTTDYYPVEYVSWYDAQAFIAKLNAISGKKYRLPTEAEWEYAARGGNKSQGDIAMFMSCSRYSPCPVGSMEPNELGIYDMCGNVSEWCHDWYGEYSSHAQTNPQGPLSGTNRVYRGNSWGSRYASSLYERRGGRDPNYRANYVGFRVVLSTHDLESEPDPVPVADFTIRFQNNNPFASTPPCSANLRNTTITYNSFTTYVWAVNGMQVSTNENITHIFTSAGTYTITLTATNDVGSHSIEKIVTIPEIESIELEMIYVQGGTFQMGCTGEKGQTCGYEEEPAHRVTVDNFSIGKYPITQKQWQAIMGYNPSYFRGDNNPVETVSWADAQEFVNKLNTITGKKYRLLTEAEWEYAARGGNKSNGYIYSGSNNLDDVAWFWKDDGGTRPVGTKQPNELGIYDMSGNVLEWCNDWYGKYSSNAQNNPQGPSTGIYRVNRGGSWAVGALECRVFSRHSGIVHDRIYAVGLRLALSQ